MASTIYARVTDELKEATDLYAEGHGMSWRRLFQIFSRAASRLAGGEQSIRTLECGPKSYRVSWIVSARRLDRSRVG